MQALSRLLATLLAVLALVMGLPATSDAQDGVKVTYKVAPSSEYTLEYPYAEDPYQPDLIYLTYKPCLARNSTYTINVSGTVNSAGPYKADLGVFDWDPHDEYPLSEQLEALGVSVSVEPSQVSGTGKFTFDAVITITTGSKLVADASYFYFGLVTDPEFPPSDGPAILITPSCIGDRAVTKTWEVAVYGDVPQGEEILVSYSTSGDSRPDTGFKLCGERHEVVCKGGGTVYTQQRTFPAGIELSYEFRRRNLIPLPDGSEDRDTFAKGSERLTADMTNSAWYDFDSGTGGLGERPVADDQQGEGGDDQQADMVTKTFQLTLNGTVPEGDAFYVVYEETDRVYREARIIVLCGESVEAACTGDGTVYIETVDLLAGTEIEYGFVRQTTDVEAEPFHGGTENIDADMTNSAWYTFGKGASEDGQETVPSDDSQGGMPDALPDTGAGGLSGAGTFPASVLAIPCLALRVCCLVRGCQSAHQQHIHGNSPQRLWNGVAREGELS